MDFLSARTNMVESQVRTNDVTDVEVQDAMRAIRREAFVAPARSSLAYSDRAVEYAPGRFLLPPRDVGKLLQAARPRNGERALAIAAPYAAAIMARMGVSVTALDTPEALAPVREALEGEGVSVLSGDLARPEGGYDLVVSEGGVAEAPQGWFEAVAPGGRLAAVIRRGAVGKATLYLRAGEAWSAREAFDSFPPLLPGFEPNREFVF
jgi:protein-L-isoaspartate(D-aspartate) O-methyltransferase